MLTLDFDDLSFEIQDGTIKNIGASTTSATVKFYHATAATAREFGDSQVKFVFDDDEGNELEVALDPEQAISLVEAVEDLREEGPVFE